jgi:hypothetical protein
VLDLFSMCDSTAVKDSTSLSHAIPRLVRDVDHTRCDANTLLWFNRDRSSEKLIWRRRDVPRAGQLLKRAKLRFAAQLSEAQIDPSALYL